MIFQEKIYLNILDFQCIEPNNGFIIQLRYFDILLKENNYDLRKINFFKGLNLRELYEKFNYLCN